jgi:hypothetical protein
MTPVDQVIHRQGSAAERPRTEKGMQALFMTAIDDTFTDPRHAVIELSRLRLTPSEICKKLNLRLRFVERVLAKLS